MQVVAELRQALHSAYPRQFSRSTPQSQLPEHLGQNGQRHVHFPNQLVTHVNGQAIAQPTASGQRTAPTQQVSPSTPPNEKPEYLRQNGHYHVYFPSQPVTHVNGEAIAQPMASGQHTGQIQQLQRKPRQR